MKSNQGSTYLFEVPSWKFILLQTYVGWIKMKTYSPTNTYMWLYVSIEHIASFCHKEIHLRCYRGLELNIATTTKILKGIRGHPMIDCNLGKIWKTCPPRCPKYRFPEVFCIKLPYKVKYTSEINEGLVMFLANSGIRFKYSWLDCEQYGKNR